LVANLRIGSPENEATASGSVKSRSTHPVPFQSGFDDSTFKKVRDEYETVKVFFYQAGPSFSGRQLALIPNLQLGN
jgi:hypothetical protein